MPNQIVKKELNRNTNLLEEVVYEEVSRTPLTESQLASDAVKLALENSGVFPDATSLQNCLDEALANLRTNGIIE